MFPADSRADFSMSLNEAAAYIDSITGRRPSMKNVYRWVDKGLGGVKLEAHKIGGRWYTGRQAIDAFLEATDKVARRPQPPVPALKKGLHDRLERRRGAEELRFAPSHDASVQFLRSKLNLMGFLMVC
jgi:hypothetical protein